MPLERVAAEEREIWEIAVVVMLQQSIRVRCWSGCTTPPHKLSVSFEVTLAETILRLPSPYPSVMLALNCTTDRKASPEGNLYSRCLSSLLVERVTDTSVPVVS